jgi:hypothetical protein
MVRDGRVARALREGRSMRWSERGREVEILTANTWRLGGIVLLIVLLLSLVVAVLIRH